MSKVSVPIPENPRAAEGSNLSDIRDGLTVGIYNPTAGQRRCKASFWARYAPGPFTPTHDRITLQFAQDLTSSATIRKWWYEPGFREWFLNREESKEKLDYLFDRSLEVAEEILDSDTAKAGEKVAVIKLISELAGKLDKTKGGEKWADDDISRMDEAQLRAYLTRKGVNLLGPAEMEQTIDVVPTETESTNTNK